MPTLLHRKLRGGRSGSFEDPQRGVFHRGGELSRFIQPSSAVSYKASAALFVFRCPGSDIRIPWRQACLRVSEPNGDRQYKFLVRP